MKVKLHFNRINMQRKDSRVWSAHTSKSCNMSETIDISHNGKIIGKAVYNPNKKDNPRAWVEFNGEVTSREGRTIIEVN
jgi:hypothetical protein